MAQSLEKIFLQKVAQMPQEEIELTPPTQRTKAGRGKGRKSSGESVTNIITRRPDVMFLIIQYKPTLAVFYSKYLYCDQIVCRSVQSCLPYGYYLKCFICTLHVSTGSPT